MSDAVNVGQINSYEQERQTEWEATSQEKKRPLEMEENKEKKRREEKKPYQWMSWEDFHDRRQRNSCLVEAEDAATWFVHCVFHLRMQCHQSPAFYTWPHVFIAIPRSPVFLYHLLLFLFDTTDKSRLLEQLNFSRRLCLCHASVLPGSVLLIPPGCSEPPSLCTCSVLLLRLSAPRFS